VRCRRARLGRQVLLQHVLRHAEQPLRRHLAWWQHAASASGALHALHAQSPARYLPKQTPPLKQASPSFSKPHAAWKPSGLPTRRFLDLHGA
jgi:hypothetical protein